MFALSPFRQTGIMWFGNNHQESATWAFSGYRTISDNYGNVYGEAGGYGTAERLTWLPVDHGDTGLVHFGVDHAFLDPARNVLQYASQDEIFVGQQPNFGPTGLSVSPIEFVPPFVNSGILNVDSVNLYNLESAVSLGRTLVQAEARWSQVATPLGTATVPAAYLHVRHVLTGEVIPYNRKTGVFGRVKPNCPVGLNSCNRGAWEVVGQVSYINLNPLLDVGAPGAGRRMVNAYAGLNWYLMNNAKIHWAWVNTSLNDRSLGDAVSNAFAMMFQADY
jgi:phosphate-selective porin OprO/OprP